MIDPPKLVERFFHWFCHLKHLEGLEGDLYEEFQSRVESRGPSYAKFHYFLDVASLIRPSVSKSFNSRNSTIMNLSILLNYIKTSFRFGRKRAWFTGINIVGLTLGITSILMIFLFVQDEWKYDNHIAELDSKFRIYDIRYGDDGEVNYLPIVPPVFAPTLKENFSQIKKAGRVMYDYGGTIFTVGENAFAEKNGLFVEKDAYEILDFKLVAGDTSGFNESYKAIISEDLYAKFFGEDPFDRQIVKLGTRDIQILGVFKNLPEQSHLEVDYVFPFAWAISGVTDERMNSWIWQQFYTYVQLENGIDRIAFEVQMKDFLIEKSKPILSESGFYYEPNLQPIKDIHLNSSDFEWDIAKRGNAQSIVFLVFAAVIILLIACLNFINLTTAQALRRAKEVGVRKFVGARRSQLIFQYAIESTMYTLVAGFIGSLICILLLPSFNDFTGKTLLLSQILTPSLIGIYLGALVLLGILSGVYPAILLTSFSPLMAVKGRTEIRTGKAGRSISFNPRQGLVGVQYILSIGLILISLIIQKQYSYLKSADMGFKKENLALIPLTRTMRQDPQLIRNSFIENPSISDVALSYGIPGGIVSGDGIFLPEVSSKEYNCNMFMADEYYIPTMEIELVAGRNFNPEMSTDVSEAFIINETAVRNFGLESAEKAIGEKVHWIVWGTQDSLKVGRIIGVVKDFNFKSLHNEMSSVVIHMGSNYFQNLIVRINSSDTYKAVSELEESYKVFEPNRPFELSFIDETFEDMYEAEQRLNWLFSLFTLLAIITAGIGLIGLISFTIVNRSKEISIRKVLGAGTGTVVGLLLRKHMIMVLVCLSVTIPIAYFLASKWLENFSFRVGIDAWLFVEVVAFTLLFTSLTIGLQTYKGARANPANKLRLE